MCKSSCEAGMTRAGDMSHEGYVQTAICGKNISSALDTRAPVKTFGVERSDSCSCGGKKTSHARGVHKKQQSHRLDGAIQ